MSDWFKKLFIDEAKAALSTSRYGGGDGSTGSTGTTGATASKLTTVTLYADKWLDDGLQYSQVVSINGITANSKIDLQPSPDQLTDLVAAGISLTTANNDGVVTVFAVGAAPETDYTIQALITEVTSK